MFYASIFLIKVKIICILVPATSSFGSRSNLYRLLLVKDELKEKTATNQLLKSLLICPKLSQRRQTRRKEPLRWWPWGSTLDSLLAKLKSRSLAVSLKSLAP